MPLGAPKSLSACQRFFLQPTSPKQRQYEALRAYYVDERPAAAAAQPDGGAGSAQGGRVRAAAPPAGRGTPRPASADGRARGGCAGVLARPAAVPDPLRRPLPLRARTPSPPPH